MKHLFFEKKNQRCKIDVKCVGNGRGRLRPVQNDRTGFPEVLGPILAKNSWNINGKTMIFRFFPSDADRSGRSGSGLSGFPVHHGPWTTLNS